MSHFNWISYDDAIRCHYRLIKQFGGKSGIREVGVLESAVLRAKNFSAYAMNSDVNVHVLAALYADGVINGHPFLDGNKRTGFLIGALFLDINGYEFHATDRQTTSAVVGLASGKIDYIEFSKFLRDNSTKK